MAKATQPPSQRFLTVNEQAVGERLWELYRKFPPQHPTVWAGDELVPITQVVLQDYDLLGLPDRLATEQSIKAAFNEQVKDVHPDWLGQKGLTPTKAQSERYRNLIAAKDRLLQRPDPDTPSLNEAVTEWHQENVARKIKTTRESFAKYPRLAGWSSNYAHRETTHPFMYFDVDHLSNSDIGDMQEALKRMLHNSEFTVDFNYVTETHRSCHALCINPIRTPASKEIFTKAGLFGGSDIMKLLDEGTTLKAAMEAAALARASRLPPRPLPLDDPPPLPPRADTVGRRAPTPPDIANREAASAPRFWEGWSLSGLGERARVSLPEAPWKGWEMPSFGWPFGGADQAASTGAGATGQASTRTTAGPQPRPSGGTAGAAIPRPATGASTTTKASPAPSTTVSASSASHRSTYSPTTATREAEGGKAGLIVAGVGAAAAGWVLWEMSKRDEQAKSDPSLTTPSA